MATIWALAILDSGVTSHFLMTTAPMTNMCPANKPIIAQLSKGKRIRSTQRLTSLSSLPWLDTPISSPALLPTPSSLLLPYKFSWSFELYVETVPGST